jgi:hypothetical protein
MENALLKGSMPIIIAVITQVLTNPYPDPAMANNLIVPWLGD